MADAAVFQLRLCCFIGNCLYQFGLRFAGYLIVSLVWIAWLHLSCTLDSPGILKFFFLLNMVNCFDNKIRA